MDISNQVTFDEAPALLPVALQIKAPGRLAIALVGSCIAADFAELCKSDDLRLDHYLMGAHPEDTKVPSVPWNEYDAILVHITLRQLMRCLLAHSNELFHVRSSIDYAHVLTRAKKNLKLAIGKVVDAVGGAKPCFFLAFSEPTSTYQGILLNNRRNSLYHFVRTLNDEMAEILQATGGSYYIEINDLLRYYGDSKISDAYVGYFAHAGMIDSPQRQIFFKAMMQRVVNALAVLKNEDRVKLIITDLDDTLWKGVLAEADEIVPQDHYEGWPLGYIEALLEFKRRGGLLAICSKNDHQSTVDRFKHLFDNNLFLEDFCSIRINWEPKSRNIGEILAETRILPSNVLFVDDNPREIEEVKRVFPDMRFLTGNQENWRSIILYSPQTQVAMISDESRARTDMIISNRKRNVLAEEMERREYLEFLHILIRFDVIEDLAHVKAERAVELLNKTNQFNTTGKRWSLSEIQEFFAQGSLMVALSSRDAFGENGLVALALLSGCEIGQVVMSCRVFGLGLEVALLCQVIERLRGESNCDEIVAVLIDTGKNKSCSTYFKDNGFAKSEQSEKYWRLGRVPRWPEWVGRS